MHISAVVSLVALAATASAVVVPDLHPVHRVFARRDPSVSMFKRAPEGSTTVPGQYTVSYTLDQNVKNSIANWPGVAPDCSSPGTNCNLTQLDYPGLQNSEEYNKSKAQTKAYFDQQIAAGVFTSCTHNEIGSILISTTCTVAPGKEAEAKAAYEAYKSKIDYVEPVILDTVPPPPNATLTSAWICYQDKWEGGNKQFVPLRINSGGDVECMANDERKECRWQDTLVACEALIVRPPTDLVITCGADYASIFGNDGYSQPNSWCTLIDKNSVPPVSRRQSSGTFGTWGERSTQSIKSSWGIDRIDQANLPLNQRYNYPTAAGQGVYAYVIDTGCRTTHTEFEGRAVHGISTCPGCQSITTDDQGHGTFVAGLIGGKVLGVAKKANIICIKALDSKGSGPNSAIIDGLNWAMKDWQRRGAPPAIINMSLGGGKSEALNRAATTATAMGMHVIVAAGNENMDASQASPASVGGSLSPVVTVGSTNINDAISSFSNYGSVVDIFAPGENVVSAAHTSDTQAKSNSGTSFSCPTVAGVVALALSSVNQTGSTFTPAQMKKLLVDSSGKNLITGLSGPKAASPNRMLYSGTDIAGTPATTTRPPAEQYQYPAPAPSTGLSTGAIVGIVIGALALAGIIGFLVLRNNKKKAAAKQQYVEPPKQQVYQQPVQQQQVYQQPVQQVYQPQMIEQAPQTYQAPVAQPQYAAPGYN